MRTEYQMKLTVNLTLNLNFFFIMKGQMINQLFKTTKSILGERKMVGRRRKLFFLCFPIPPLSIDRINLCSRQPCCSRLFAHCNNLKKAKRPRILVPRIPPKITKLLQKTTKQWCRHYSEITLMSLISMSGRFFGLETSNQSGW